jgi:hypothetical protein
MLKTRMKRLSVRNERAAERLIEIETSVTRLNDEDLLDLADIFRAETLTVLGEIANAEMTRRGISL